MGDSGYPEVAEWRTWNSYLKSRWSVTPFRFRDRGFRLYWRVPQQRVRRLRPGRVVGTESGAVEWKFLTCFELMASLLCC